MTFNLLKGVGNQHFELVRVSGFVSLVSAIGFTGYHLAVNHAFSIVEFGTGTALIIAAIGAGSAVKDTAVAKANAMQGSGE